MERKVLIEIFLYGNSGKKVLGWFLYTCFIMWSSEGMSSESFDGPVMESRKRTFLKAKVDLLSDPGTVLR